MFDQLPYDIIFSLLSMFDDINDIINIACINKAIYNLLDDRFYTSWGRRIYSDEFWNIAEKRNPILSNPLPNMKLELLRINNFNNYQIKLGYEIWSNEDYYMYWKCIDNVYNSKNKLITISS